MSEKNRVQLTDDQVEEVTAGLLSMKLLGDGYCYVQVRDADFNVVQQYKIKHGARTVNQLLQDMYWTFDAGSRDSQMISYLQQNGYI